MQLVPHSTGQSIPQAFLLRNYFAVIYIVNKRISGQCAFISIESHAVPHYCSATVQCLKVPERGVVIFGYFVYNTFISFENMKKFCWLLNKSVFSHEWVQNSQTWQNIQANIPGGRAVNTSKFIVNFMSNKLLPNRKAHLRARITWTHHFFFARNSMYSKVSGIFQW